jgi:hypothetical protein
LISDLEDTRIVLNAALNYFQARDMETAQLNFTATRPSPLTAEIQRVKTRLDGVLGDYLLQQHESGSGLYDDESFLDDEEDAEDAEDGLQSLTEASQEPLPDAAFSEPKLSRQAGRRLTAKEAAGDASE